MASDERQYPPLAMMLQSHGFRSGDQCENLTAHGGDVSCS